MSASEYPLFLLSFLGNHIEFVIGYAACVLFPIPGVNRWIIDMWAKLLSKSESNTNGPTGPTGA
jgi:hypothetical protein